MKSYLYIIALMVLFLGAVSCAKFLDEKPDQSMAVPSRLEDLQAILDYELWMVNGNLALGDIASDYFYLDFGDWSPRQERHREAYLWSPTADVFDDWRNGYTMIFNANLVLEEVDDIALGRMTEADRQRIKGSALFYRAWALYQLIQIYAPAYDPSQANEQMGLPIKLSPNINEETLRTDLHRNYEQIIDDLLKAVDLLPINVSVPSRPSVGAGFALLARVYMAMANYDEALNHTEQAFSLGVPLIDYNTLDSTANNPFAVFNEEVVFHARVASNSNMLSRARAKLTPELHALYDEADLRLRMLYIENTDGSYIFKGNLTGGNILFAGISSGELYLNFAECLARTGELNRAQELVNELLINRYENGAFESTVFENQEEAMRAILSERRKELAFRTGIRWADLKRLNREGLYSTTLYRSMDGNNYELPPSDLRYTFLIPFEVIDRTGIEQNAR